jgi:molecular chaperone GrpE
MNADPSDSPPPDGAGEPSTSPPGPGTSPESRETRPAEEWETRFKYLLADFENFRRRSERERESASRQTRGGLLRELLPILEAFQSARDAIGRLPSADPVRRGLELLDREWAKFLKREGVEPVASIGSPFRADEEEAVGESPARDGAADGSVVEIVQQGYRFFGGLLRPAKVIVARLPPTAPAGPPAEPASASSEEKR